MVNKNYFEIEDDKCEEWSKILWNILQTNENNLYLIGAWCSVTSWWKIMSTLWSEFEASIVKFETLKVDAWYEKWSNLEELLTKIKISENYFNNIWDTDKEEEMRDFRSQIEVKLKEHCKTDIKIVEGKTAHPQLIEKITNSRKPSLPRTKVFSLNYDTLFEQAANDWWYTVIDWFSFSIPRKFNWNNFDLDVVKRNNSNLEKENNFEKKVFHLYKLHWSINWEEKDWEITQFEWAEWKLIYPWSSKYEESYEMPYFEMISRFQQELRNENVTLTVSWYSFSDNHINSIIVEAFKTNPSLNLIIVWTSIFDKATKEINVENVKILNEWLKMNRVFLFNMYFEPFVNLIPISIIKTKEETMLDAMHNFKKNNT